MHKTSFLFILIVISPLVGSCAGTQSSILPITPSISSQTPQGVRVSLKQVNPWESDYYLWDSLLGPQKQKQLTWKEAKELSPRQLFFIKDGFSLDGKKYEGKLFLEKDYKKRLRLINEIDMELYLKGVVPSEMPPNWPIEALKAQAVVSRTYGSYDFANSTGFLESSVLDQVYGGEKNRRPSTDHAVDATRGQVLTDNGKIFPAYFHSASGGITTTIPYVWPKRKNFGAVESVKDKYSKDSPYQDWETKLSPAEISEALKKSGHDMGVISSLQVIEREPSGRAHKIKVVGSKQTKIFQGNEFRLALGWKNLKSTLFDLSVANGKYVFKGHGFGHGVGLSQIGAKKMAEKGHNYKQILKYYFPTAKLRG